MSATDVYTAADLGITGPHLVASDLDCRDLIVHEILEYKALWTSGTGVRFTYLAPGVLEPIACGVPLTRLRIEGVTS